MENRYTAAVITVSDKGFAGLRKDTSGPAIVELLKGDGYEVISASIVPDDMERITAELTACADRLSPCLIVTTGGTGFSRRDVTPEATKAIVQREVPGIPEAMRAESMRITPRGCLSREAAGIRGDTLIINCPGSEKAARECLTAVLPALKHGIQILRGWAGECSSHNGHEHKERHQNG